MPDIPTGEVAISHAIVRHSHDLTFLAKGDSNHWLVMDGSEASGGCDAGSRPKELVLFALGGCTAFDVAEILRKRRLDVRSFTIDLEAEEADTQPRVFTKIQLTYNVEGEGVQPSDLELAIHLSLEKYCSVSAMLRRAVPIHWRAMLNGAEVASGMETDAT
ncbi:MAG TPA: OsmC family protein [bacterium]|nr:OsmC family protein [bacterium]